MDAFELPHNKVRQKRGLLGSTSVGASWSRPLLGLDREESHTGDSSSEGCAYASSVPSMPLHSRPASGTPA